MSAYTVDLPTDVDWSLVDFTIAAVWGNGNNGNDAWGMGTGDGKWGTLEVSDLQRKGNGAPFISVTVKNPDPHLGEALAFISRYKIGDKEGVFSTQITQNLD